LSNFSPSGSAGATTQVSVLAATTPTVQLVSLAAAGTPQDAYLPAGAKQYQLRLLGNSTLLVSYDGGATYATIPPGCADVWLDLALQNQQILTLQSPVANQIAELVYWI